LGRRHRAREDAGGIAKSAEPATSSTAGRMGGNAGHASTFMGAAGTDAMDREAERMAGRRFREDAGHAGRPRSWRPEETGSAAAGVRRPSTGRDGSGYAPSAWDGPARRWNIVRPGEARMTIA